MPVTMSFARSALLLLSWQAAIGRAAPSTSADARLTMLPAQTTVVLGRTRAVPVSIQVQSRGDSADIALEVRTNIGRISDLAAVGPNRYLAIYEPPRTPYPRIAVLVASLRAGKRILHARASITLLGSAGLQVQTLPGSEITVECAGRRYGPLLVGAGGVVAVRLEELTPHTKSYVVSARSAAGRVATRSEGLLVPAAPMLTLGPVLGTEGGAELALAGADPEDARKASCSAGAAPLPIAPAAHGIGVVRIPAALAGELIECTDAHGAKLTAGRGAPVQPSPMTTEDDGELTIAAPLHESVLPMDAAADRSVAVGMGVHADSRGGVGPVVLTTLAGGGGEWSVLADLALARGAGEPQRPPEVSVDGGGSPWLLSLTAATLRVTQLNPTTSLGLGLGLGGQATYTVVGSRSGTGVAGSLSPHVAAMTRLGFIVAAPTWVELGLTALIAPPTPDVDWRATALLTVGLRRGWYLD